MKLAYKISIVVFFVILNIFGFSQTLKLKEHFEFRGVWVATVDNIDWPSSKNLTTEQQKQEFIQLVQMHKKNRMNALVVQIRPCADAFYPNNVEPWSEYLTGTQGKPPYPFYDPLAFMIEETHKAGLEFHAWLNPYRAVYSLKKSSIAQTHVTELKKEWFLNYGDKKYFDPGLPEVQEYTCNIIKYILNNYDIDAIHVDDYFYPYKIAGLEFPDNASYQKYGNGLSQIDWRRSNCDSIIKKIYFTIKSINPQIKFGVSPFGVWRNKSVDSLGSNTNAGQTNYDDLYADILLWLKMGWVDYIVPQLYWEKGHNKADFDVLLPWWNNNSYGKHLYIGLGIYRSVPSKLGNPLWKNQRELFDQLKDIQETNGVLGSCYFNSTSFINLPKNSIDSLRMNYYKNQALLPTMSYLPNININKAVVHKKHDSYLISYSGKELIKGFVLVYTDINDPLHTTIEKIYVSDHKIKIPISDLNNLNSKKWYIYVIGRWNHLSEPIELIH